MTTKPGLYMSSHEGCTICAAHRHPREATQPRTITFDVPATVTYEVVVDTDGTARVRAASVLVDAWAINGHGTPEVYHEADALAGRDAEEAEVTRLYAEADATRERVLDAVLVYRDAECAVDDGWSHEWPAPVLDEAVEA